MSQRGIRLKHLNRSGEYKSGNPRWYYRPVGEKGVPMPDAAMGSVVFLSAYTAAAGVKPVRPIIKGTLASAVAKYIANSSFTILAPNTQKERRRVLARISETVGDAKALTPDVIQKYLLDYDGNAQITNLKTWKGFCKFLRQTGAIKTDPCRDIERSAVAKSDGHVPWDEDQIEHFRKFYSIDAPARLAFEVLYYTGASLVDAVRLGPGFISKGGWLSYRRQKSGVLVEIPFDRELPHFARSFQRDLNFLNQCIAAQPNQNMTWIVSRGHDNRGSAKSLDPKYASTWFSRLSANAGIIGRGAHGLRKSRDMAIAANLGSATACMSWLGHSTLKDASHYIKLFDRRRALSVPKGERE